MVVHRSKNTFKDELLEQNLIGFNFNDSYFEGVDLSSRNLDKATFINSKFLITRQWKSFLVLVGLLIAALSGCLVGIGSVISIILLFEDSSFAYGFVIIGSLLFSAFFTLKKGFILGVSFGLFSLLPFLFLSAILPIFISQKDLTTNIGTSFFFGAISIVLSSLGSVLILTAIQLITILKSKNLAIFLGFPVSIFIAFITIQSFKTILILASIPMIFGILSFSSYINSRIPEETSEFQWVLKIVILIITKKGNFFVKSNLSEVNFAEADLKFCNFQFANLCRTRFFQAKGLDISRVDNTYLANPKIRQLVVTCDGQGKIFDGLDLTGVNLQNGELQDASFIGANLNQSSLRGADLSRAFLKQTQLDGADLTGATLTGAYIEDWGITSTTILDNVQCEYVFMRVPTKENPNPLRKPDNWRETFAEGEFADFIQPFFDTLDLYHSQDVDPRAISIALKELSAKHPEDDLQFIAIERRGNHGVNLRFKTSPRANKSELSQEYFENYDQIKKELPVSVQIRLAEQDAEIRSLKGTIEQFILTGTHQSTIQAETIQVIQGDSVVTEHRGIQINAGDNTTISGIGSDDSSVNSDAIKTILVLAANPKGTNSLRLGEEVRKIQAGLERSQYRDRFKLEQRWAVTPTDVRRALLDCQPQIVHFCGHGVGAETDQSASSSSRKLTILADNLPEPEGLIFEDEMGNPQLVSGSVIADLFGLFNDQIECVVLNACYSSVQANTIMQQIPYVVGMSRWINDQAAIQFAIGFYDAILAGQSVEFSYKLGCNAIQMANIPDHLVPKLHQKLS